MYFKIRILKKNPHGGNDPYILYMSHSISDDSKNVISKLFLCYRITNLMLKFYRSRTRRVNDRIF